jgi:hypothetical protein
VLLLQPGVMPSTPISAFLRGDAEDHRTLRMAAGLAAAYGAPLSVLTTAEGRSAVEALVRALGGAALAGLEVSVQALRRPAAELADLREEIRRGILVVAASLCAEQDDARLCALAELPFSVVLAR